MALQNHGIHLYLHDGREGKGDFLLLLDIREELKDLNAALFTFTHRKEARDAFFFRFPAGVLGLPLLHLASLVGLHPFCTVLASPSP